MARLELSRIPLSELARDREAHFYRLGESPELYVESILVSDGLHLMWDSLRVGYALVSSENVLLELNLVPDAWHARHEIFCGLVSAASITSALCFSFDELLKELCTRVKWFCEIDGHLFRSIIAQPCRQDAASVSLRLAVETDIVVICDHRDGVFETDAECREWVTRGFVWVLSRHACNATGIADLDLAAEERRGVGILTPVWPSRAERDVGVLIFPQHRMQGYATWILSELKRRCVDAGWRPIAGCATDNVASASALKRAGFVLSHHLLHYKSHLPLPVATGTSSASEVAPAE